MTEYPRIVGAVALVCGSNATAEDAVQEALARAWERSERGEQLREPTAWVTAVAMNLARSGLRRVLAERRARRRLPETSPSPPEEALDVKRQLGRLPRRQREATILRYWLGLDLREIASVMGVSEGTVKTTLFRARRSLAGALGLQEEEGVPE
jgi:RNA polymerase sigma-70 factor, ECF subfamily